MFENLKVVKKVEKQADPKFVETDRVMKGNGELLIHIVTEVHPTVSGYIYVLNSKHAVEERCLMDVKECLEQHVVRINKEVAKLEEQREIVRDMLVDETSRKGNNLDIKA